MGNHRELPLRKTRCTVKTIAGAGPFACPQENETFSLNT